MSTPTSWTDTGLDWTAADPMWPLELLNQCMIEAIKECEAMIHCHDSFPTGYKLRDSQGTLIPTPSCITNPYDPILPNKTYTDAIHLMISSYLTPVYVTNWGYVYCFINHEIDAAGYDGIEYTGGAEPNVYPLPVHYWNETTALASIGDSARLPVPDKTSGNLSAWYFQQYKFLNLFRWTFLYHSPTSGGCYINLNWSSNPIPVQIFQNHSVESIYRQTFSGNVSLTGNTRIFTPWPSGYGNSGQEFKSIVKFDGANGKKFKNW
ncbi:MAG: hypothetical protein A2X45_25710 [Lentisphaerae bacterium GWF2_50_93]|nr:MAG: hypothetical protein A2X45_25710 [Lentisphaerae bacterium GWF2_50_93]